MPSIEAMLDDVLRKEGGYVDDPADAGGATNRGISLRYAKGVGLDLDGDGDTDKDDIRLVTVEDAKRLYREDFYTGPRIDTLPVAIQPVLFDYAVNSGPPRALMAMQRVLNLADFPCDVDGVIGPQTRKQADVASEAMGGYLVNAICDYRQRFYDRIVERNPSQQRFLKGWTRRCDSFRVEV
ncbi:glycoside hydrolase family 108 protein [Photobacterium phosphoreum]|uniref:glycoside hydrolase family 108 protein n=1 Tax=Photobacterium phosphoreum TaxID=659 RepID=UPI0024B7DBE8|nr:glycosyl hydrolase 108 family protein [Photobacterium phosphoreum]